jgi:adenine deaminase
MDLKSLIDVASGREKADLVLKNARIVNVFTREIIYADVAIYNGFIAGIGKYDGKENKDLNGKYLIPGLIDGHVHLESSMVSISEYAKAMLYHGVTTIVIDPHEITNVLGVEGIKYILKETENIPLNVYIMIPSCVPSSPLETSGAKIKPSDIKKLMKFNRVIGLAEMMNFPGVFNGLKSELDKIKASNYHIDGHSPGLSGKNLNAYIASGIYSDHECFTLEEGLEKSKLGMWIMIREGSASKNLDTLLPLVRDKKITRALWVTDDKCPKDLIEEGSIDHIIRKAIKNGLDPITAVQLGTINSAIYHRLDKIGAIAPGFKADMCVLDDLDNFTINMIYKDGILVKEVDLVSRGDKRVFKTIKVKGFNKDKLKIKAKGNKGRVIGIIEGEIITRSLEMNLKIKDGYVVSDIENDVLKIAVVERHKRTGRVGVGLVKGFMLKQGAFGTSVAHDAHNIIVVGTNDEDMFVAVKEIIKLQGGLVVVNNKRVLGNLPLPIAGLMSNLPLNEVANRIKNLEEILKNMGVMMKSPFMTLSFLALPVIPELKITDLGVIDVNKFKIVEVFL